MFSRDFSCRQYAQAAGDVNETKSKLLGGYLRAHLLDNMNSKEPAKELVKRSFRWANEKKTEILVRRDWMPDTAFAPDHLFREEIILISTENNMIGFWGARSLFFLYRAPVISGIFKQG